MSTEPLLAFKAGRALRREGTNSVDHDPTKGAIYLVNEADGLMHLKWMNRSTTDFEEDLILFPEDATFTKIQQASWGRTYVLKFSSSNQKHFFWMQDASGSRDDEFVYHLNEYLRNPEYTAVWDSTTSQPGTSTGSSSAVPQATPEQLARLQELLSGMTGSSALTPDVTLNDILTTDNLFPLFRAHPELVPSIFPSLPSDLPVPPSAEVLERVISSAQFQSAVRSFDQALRTGLLGGLVRGLGLPEEAGTGILPFLRAIQDQARQSGGSSAHRDGMDTD